MNALISACGTYRYWLPRGKQVAEILRSKGARLWRLGTNENGGPKHPLYIKRDTALIEWVGDGII